MNQKVLRLTNLLLEKISQLSGVEAVQRVPYLSHGRNNPLFYLKFDVYFNEAITPPVQRLETFSSLHLTETGQSLTKDMFFLQDIPIRLDYKRTSDLATLVDNVFNPPYDLRHDSTFCLFRILHGIPLLEKSSWLKDLRDRLHQVPEAFWVNHHRTLANRLEHLLSDMGAAIFNQDPIHYQLAFARYLETVVEALFNLNREFLGPQEELAARIQNLEILPAGFDGLFGNLLRDDGSLDKDRRLEIARLLAIGLRSFS